MKRYKVIFLIAIIIFPIFLIVFPLAIYNDYLNSFRVDFFIKPPHSTKKVSINKNQYMHSFFASPFDNYVIYKEKSSKPKENLFDNQMEYYGESKYLKNVINDTYDLNMWQKDNDQLAFIIQPFVNADSIELSIKNEENLIDHGISIEYGFQKLVYSEYKNSFPDDNHFWFPDKMTQNKIQSDLRENWVYSSWIKVEYDLSCNTLDSKIDSLILNTSMKKEGINIYSQENKINLNYVNLDYTAFEKADDPGIDYVNSDNHMIYYLNHIGQGGLSKPTDIDEESVLDYEKWSWKNYLEKYWDKMRELNNNYYTMFLSNINNNYENINEKEKKYSLNVSQTWENSGNDATLVTWHARKMSDGKYELYIPTDNEQAFFYNLNQVLGKGISRIMLRGFGELKYYQKDNDQSKLMNKIWNDDTNELESVDLKLVNGGDKVKNQFGFNSEEMITMYLKWFESKLDEYKNNDNFFNSNDVNNFLKNSNANYYLMFDEVRSSEVNLESKLVKSKFNEFKIAWCGVGVYNDWSINMDYCDIIWYNLVTYDDADNSDTVIGKVIKKRKSLGLETSIYALSSDVVREQTGFSPAESAYRGLYTNENDIRGYMRYTINHWYPDSNWIANPLYNNSIYDTTPGDEIFIYPNLYDENKLYWATSPRLEMISQGQILAKKLNYLYSIRTNSRENISKISSLFNENNIRIKETNRDRFTFDYDLESSFKRYKDTYVEMYNSKSPFLNWIANRNFKYGDEVFGLVEAVKVAYFYANKWGVN